MNIDNNFSRFNDFIRFVHEFSFRAEMWTARVFQRDLTWAHKIRQSYQSLRSLVAVRFKKKKNTCTNTQEDLGLQKLDIE